MATILLVEDARDVRMVMCGSPRGGAERRQAHLGFRQCVHGVAKGVPS